MTIPYSQTVEFQEIHARRRREKYAEACRANRATKERNAKMVQSLTSTRTQAEWDALVEEACRVKKLDDKMAEAVKAGIRQKDDQHA